MLKKLFTAIIIIATTIFAQTDGDTKTITARGVSIEVVFVGAGSFTAEDGARVNLTQSFWIGKYPITQAQFQTIFLHQSWFRGRPDNPVESVSWNSANTFADRVGGFLPTEAQWEFAARGGNKSLGFIYSGSNNIDEVAWHGVCCCVGGSTQPVGQKKSNELGIYDMSGNVWEWTVDLFAGNRDHRVIRGGSWSDAEDRCRVYARRSFDSGDSWRHLGFRVAFPADNNGTSITQTTNRTPTSFSFAGIHDGQINLQLQAGNYTAELYNLQGRLVGRASINAINGVNASGLRTDNLPSGIFYLNVKQKGVSVLQHKIFVR